MLLRRIWNRATAPFQLFYWQITLPEAEGAKLLIEHKGKFLMIRETYGQKHWTFPGGRRKELETPEDTARRKAKEEVGITLRNPKLLGSYFHTRQYKKDAICVYHAHVKSPQYTPDTDIVLESGWFSIDEMAALPRSESVDDALELWKRHHG
jgi:ADP-ribose pyrophosphatase YjhB (NUDIX family)